MGNKSLRSFLPKSEAVTPASADAFATTKSSGSAALGLGASVSLALYINALATSQKAEWQSLIALAAVALGISLTKMLLSIILAAKNMQPKGGSAAQNTLEAEANDNAAVEALRNAARAVVNAG